MDQRTINLILNCGDESQTPHERATLLSGAFLWDMTSQGQKFWSIQYRRLASGRDLTLKGKSELQKMLGSGA